MYYILVSYGGHRFLASAPMSNLKDAKTRAAAIQRDRSTQAIGKPGARPKVTVLQVIYEAFK